LIKNISYALTSYLTVGAVTRAHKREDRHSFIYLLGDSSHEIYRHEEGKEMHQRPISVPGRHHQQPARRDKEA
jgi:hypothetical protein